MNILIIDPAAITGFALVNIENKIARIIEYGIVIVDTEKEYMGDSCLDLSRKIQDLFDLYKIKKVAIEDFFFSRKYATGSTNNVAYRTAIHILCRSQNPPIPYTILNISAWKRHISGRTSPTKEEKKKWGVNAKKFFIQEALWKKYEMRFPNWIISPKNKKPMTMKSDVIDATAMAIYYCEKFENCNKVKMLVNPPEDLKIKGKCYSY